MPALPKTPSTEKKYQTDTKRKKRINIYHEKLKQEPISYTVAESAESAESAETLEETLSRERERRPDSDLASNPEQTLAFSCAVQSLVPVSCTVRRDQPQSTAFLERCKLSASLLHSERTGASCQCQSPAIRGASELFPEPIYIASTKERRADPAEQEEKLQRKQQAVQSH